MSWYDTEYLADSRERTLTLITPDMRSELWRITSSTRRAVKAVSSEFERLVRAGYKVIDWPGVGMSRNPLTAPAGADQDLARRLVEEAGLWDTPDRLQSHGMAAAAFSRGWIAESHIPDVAAITRAISHLARARGGTPRRTVHLAEALQYRTLETLKRMADDDRPREAGLRERARAILGVVQGSGGRNPRRNPGGGVDYESMGSLMFRPGECLQARQTASLLRRAGYRAVVEGPGKPSRSREDRRVLRGYPIVWSDAPRNLMSAAFMLLSPSTGYHDPAKAARMDYPAEYAILAPLLEGPKRNPSSFRRDENEAEALAFPMVQEALKAGRVDDSGGRTLELLIRHWLLSRREAAHLLDAAGPMASGREISAAWRELQAADPQFSGDENRRIADLRVNALGKERRGY